MIKICIVEDDVAEMERLEKCLFRYTETHGHEIVVSKYTNAEDFLQNYSMDCEVIFMDIELPGINGIEAMKRIREIDKKVVVVFVTHLIQCAVEGYQVQAFDFVVKPVNYYEFALKLKNLFEYLKNFRKILIMTSSHQGKRVINVSDLKYVEVIKHDIIYHTSDENIVCSGTLKQVCEELKDVSFALCNQCYLVNLRYVKGITGNTLYLGDEELQISAPKRKSFINALTKYIANGVKE